MTDWDVVRTIRTSTSERFLLRRRGNDIAALDLHYGLGNRCDGTLIVFEGSGIEESHVPALLKEIDERLLPDASLGDRNLAFTVVVGRVLGAFLPTAD
jgi:hypothetical protein